MAGYAYRILRAVGAITAAGASYQMITEGDERLYIPLIVAGSAAVVYSFVKNGLPLANSQTETPPTIESIRDKNNEIDAPKRGVAFDLEKMLSEAQKIPLRECNNVVHGNNGSYLLREVLYCMGPFATVYRAQELESQLDVAVKIYDREYAALQGFLQEAEAARSIAKHNPDGRPRNVLPVVEVIPRELAVVTPFCEMGTLHKKIRREDKLSVFQTAAALSDLCDGLDASHAAGVLHRDVKPSNILLRKTDLKREDEFEIDPSAKHTHALLSDYDISVCENTVQFERRGTATGTPLYQAPELYLENIRWDDLDTLRTIDIYAAGITAYEMLTGKVPFKGEHIDILKQHARKPLPKHPAIPAPFMAVLERACEKKPQNRHQRAGELKEDVLRTVRML